MVALHYHHGTLVAPALPAPYALPAWQHDGRTGTHRAPAHAYGPIVAAWRAAALPFEDAAATYGGLPLRLRRPVSPYPHQASALAAWEASGRRGVVVLPTGSGKTLLAVLAIVACRVPALVVVPTLDLMQQWYEVLCATVEAAPAGPAPPAEPLVGRLGGGLHERAALTVATYDSAALQAEFVGRRFGLVVFDECHHLPAPSYRFIAAAAVAPARLGLTATLERADGGEATVQALVGPVCHRLEASALRGTYLAPFTLQRCEVPMAPDEAAAYRGERQIYTDFLRQQGLRLAAPGGWAQFLQRAGRSDAGRRALRAYRAQRRLALTCRGKVALLWELLVRHRDDCCIVFTDDNETVYRLSAELLLPAITHHTRPPERRAILAGLADGSLLGVLTSRVLNEGVDVPRANVGIVLSGSGSVREHVQRLGRLLRRQPGKHAVLYEVCSATGAEAGISERRRQHAVYRC